MPKQI